MSIDIQREDGVVVGYVEGDTFFKLLNEEIHKLRTPPGWSNDEVALRQASQAGAIWCVIHTTDTEKIYRATIATIWTYGVYFERGHGKQLVLLDKHWDIKDPMQPELF